MKALDRKLARDLFRLRAQAAAVVLVVACATGTYLAAAGTQAALLEARSQYYEQQRFADIYATLKRAPHRLLGQIATIPGVAQVDGRVVTDAPLFVPGLGEPATARLIGLPVGGADGLNRVELRRGRLPERGEDFAAVVSDAFARAHSIELGMTFEVVVEGRRRAVVVRGIGVSPEHLYQIRAGDIMPDDQHYAIFWMERASLEAALRMTAAFNDVVLKLAPGANEEAVTVELDRMLAPHGGRGAYGASSQISNRFLTDEIMQLGMMTLGLPTVLLGVAAFLLSVVIGRLVSTQRQEIAVLKAFGYSNLAVGLHYAKLVSVIAGSGVLLGLLLGYGMGSGLTSTYTQMFRLPRLPFTIMPTTAAAALGWSMLAAQVGAVRALHDAVSVTPAMAMRAKAPATYRRTLAERLPGFVLLPQSARMVVRELIRRPARALLTTVTLSFAVGIVIVGAYVMNALMTVADQQFYVCERADATVLLREPHPNGAVRELARFPGVRRVEAFRHVGVVFRHGTRSYRAGLLGIDGGSELKRVIDGEHRRTPISSRGLVLTDRLAVHLGVKPGDVLEVEMLEGSRLRRPATVAALTSEYVGMSAYTELSELNRLLDAPDTVSGAFVSIDPSQESLFHAAVRNTPDLAGTTFRRLALASFNAVITGHIAEIARILMLSSCVIAIGVLYSSAYLALAEKQRELAMLRLLGFTRQETATILLGELTIQLVVSLPLGLLLGRAIAVGLSAAMESDLYRLPVVIGASTYLFTLAVVLGAGVAVGLVAKRQIDRMPFAELLKSRE